MKKYILNLKKAMSQWIKLIGNIFSERKKIVQSNNERSLNTKWNFTENMKL